MDKKQDAMRAARWGHAHPVTIRREKAAIIRQRIQTAYTREEIPRGSVRYPPRSRGPGGASLMTPLEQLRSTGPHAGLASLSGELFAVWVTLPRPQRTALAFRWCPKYEPECPNWTCVCRMVRP